MSSSITSGVTELGSTVSGMWRSHSVLSESEGESSPETAQQFRKMRSSTSLNSLRMSLRRRFPLKSVQPNTIIPENPTCESVQINKKPSKVTQIKRSAKNSIGNAYQKFQKINTSHEEYLVKTPGQTAEGEENKCSVSTTRTPKRQAPTPRRTPRSGTKRVPKAAVTPEPSDAAVRAVRTGGTRRQLVRMAALRSPFASPNTMSRRRELDQDLDCVAKGLMKLKRLSMAFDDVIGREDRIEAMERYKKVLAESYSSQSNTTGKINPSTVRQKSRQIRHRVSSWTDGAFLNLRRTSR